MKVVARYPKGFFSDHTGDLYVTGMDPLAPSIPKLGPRSAAKEYPEREALAMAVQVREHHFGFERVFVE